MTDRISTDELRHAAQSRRLYHHVLHGGSLTPDDVSRMVQIIEELEAKVIFLREDSAAAWDKCEERRLAQEKAEAKVIELREYAASATRTITGLTPGGSEYFAGRIGDIYLADLKRCESIIRAQRETPHKRWKEAKSQAKRLEAEVIELRAEVERLNKLTVDLGTIAGQWESLANAADEDVIRLREALAAISDHPIGSVTDKETARAALNHKETEE